MSYITLAQQGMAAAQERRWEDGISRLSAALKESLNPAWLLARSKCLVSTGRPREALKDADLAWHTAYERNKRELIVEAQYRRAVAYLRMKQYANADCCCFYAMRLLKKQPPVETEDPARGLTDKDGFWAVKLDDVKREALQEEQDRSSQSEGKVPVASSPLDFKNDKGSKDWRMASTLRMQALHAMQKLPANDAARKVTTTYKPPKPALAHIESEEKDSVQPKAETTSKAEHNDDPTRQIAQDKEASKQADKSIPLTKPTLPPFQNYQSDQFVNLSIFSKKVDKSQLVIEFEPSSITFGHLKSHDGQDVSCSLTLPYEIVPAESSFAVTPSKVELRLKKTIQKKWDNIPAQMTTITSSALADGPVASQAIGSEAKPDSQAETSPKATGSKASSKNVPPKPAAEASAASPSYPTSSRSGPKNWDAIVDDMDADDKEEEQGVNTFFKTLYKGATAEQQRAMMKSFTESNGTSLSTNWEDVKDRKVETVPPQGVEAKKWD